MSKTKSVRFGQQYGVSRVASDDWFDPLLNEDTKLFIDPFLIYLDTDPFWTNAHTQLMEFFNVVLKTLAQSGFKKESSLYQKAKHLLLYPEPPEFCLGLSKESIFGAGSAKGLQDGMLEGAATTIKLGLDSLKHFEELALFGEQIGPDRIGDITCNVLKPEFVEYTQEIARRHAIPLVTVNVRTCGWDPTGRTWKPGLVELPKNPIASKLTGHPVGVLLTPKRFLRRIPSIDPQEFWDFAWENEPEQMRAEFSGMIGQRVDAKTIARFARTHRVALTRYLDALEQTKADPYDVDEDPALIVKRRDFEKQITESLAIMPPTTEAEFVNFVELLISNFKRCVEERGAWQMLWVEDRPRTERVVQSLFQTSAVQACEDRDVDISPESDAGRGSVDFKVSKGWRLRVLLELKLAKSSSFKRNLKNQTEIYVKAEGCDRGYFVVIQYTDEDCDPVFVADAERVASEVAAAKGIVFQIVFVDARPKPSASRV